MHGATRLVSYLYSGTFDILCLCVTCKVFPRENCNRNTSVIRVYEIVSNLFNCPLNYFSVHLIAISLLHLVPVESFSLFCVLIIVGPDECNPTQSDMHSCYCGIIAIDIFHFQY